MVRQNDPGYVVEVHHENTEQCEPVTIGEDDEITILRYHSFLIPESTLNLMSRSAPVNSSKIENRDYSSFLR